ncbi:MAG: phage/plasmid primase, P4 family [Syntrophales bacterium]|jgi:putative DNA primase/helicase|nr:phage/plasmid primase, P4 family [Syntrophales bacterium]
MTKLISDKETFITMASDFFNELFEPAFNSECGNIEIRTFKPSPQQNFYTSEHEAAERAFDLCNRGIDVYFGVNPRTGNAGRKENIQYLSAFHAEIDYGATGHKKETPHTTYEEALSAIESFNPEPTIIIHSGGGFHCYWVLSNPVKVDAIGSQILESINKNLSEKLGGDRGTQDISRVLRIPGTFNFKIPDNPREVSLIFNSHKKYKYEDFMEFISCGIPNESKPAAKVCNNKGQAISLSSTVSTVDIDSLPVSEKIKNLIKNGNNGSYSSRSEADMAVITVLVSKGLSENEIKSIFQAQAIGEKYRSHNAPDQYLKHSVQKAKEQSNLTEEEMQNPLFISGAIFKSEKGCRLNVLKFEEYMVKKHMIKVMEQENAFFKYNGKCYEYCTEKTLNNLCQNELGDYRAHFSKANLNELIHYAIGDALIKSEHARINQIKYLTLQNGLYDLDAFQLIGHSRDIFTTNLLPYNYDPEANCPRFIQFLQEIFEGNQEKIEFVQEAVGYAFHKSLPTPAVFFLVGSGSNGKSVFINTIASLIGKDNTSNVSFNALSNEYYVLELFQKMINISAETPQGRSINTDAVKAATAGDWITGRELYKQPMKFRPFAKHFLAMNKPPVIMDQSHGMWRRIWVLEFNRRFTENDMDRQLEEKLVNELSGIFNWALAGYKKLKEKKFALSEPPSMKMSKKEYRNGLNSDSIKSFEKRHLEKSDDPKDRIILADTYDCYMAYCKREGKTDIQAKGDFKTRLIDMGYEIKSSTRHGNKVCIFNVKMKPIE